MPERTSILFVSSLALFFTKLNADDFGGYYDDARWSVHSDDAGVELSVAWQGTVLSSGPLPGVEGDVEIRDLGDGIAQPALAHSGRLGGCGVTVDVGLENEAAWVSIHDCAEDAPLGGFAFRQLILLPPASAETTLAGWDGRWVMEDDEYRYASIHIFAGNERLQVQGMATNASSEYSIHIAEFEGVLQPDNNQLVYDQSMLQDSSSEPQCHVIMMLSDDVLEVEDNRRCGGLNVSFSGTYRLASEHD